MYEVSMDVTKHVVEDVGKAFGKWLENETDGIQGLPGQKTGSSFYVYQEGSKNRSSNLYTDNSVVSLR